jgi:glycosyltransferase involved in cell wall biosynthesis
LLESLRAVTHCNTPELRFFIIGSLHESIRSQAEELIAADYRITYLGWKSPDELTDFLCAADVYLQPGTQSATMQHSLCCRCPVIIDDVPAHEVYMHDNGWLLNKDLTLPSVLKKIHEANLPEMSENSYDLARRILDYSALSKRVLQ